MAAPPPAAPPTKAPEPQLTPQFCLNTTVLRDFLRLSRSTVDDSISQHLNSLLTPSRTHPFNPLSTSSTSQLPTAATRNNIPKQTCERFKTEILFPSWKTRADVMSYCGRVAEAEISQRQDSQSATSSSTQSRGDAAVDDRVVDDASPVATSSPSRNYWNQPQVVDERTDPYSGRDYSYTREAAAQVLKDILAIESGVERVVKSRTWRVLGERCVEGPGGSGEGWEDEWQTWLRR